MNNTGLNNTELNNKTLKIHLQCSPVMMLNTAITAAIFDCCVASTSYKMSITSKQGGTALRQLYTST